MNQAVADRRLAEIVRIQPSRGWVGINLRELWRYRELIYFLVWREVKGRYRQMAFGPLWIIIQPLINMVILSIVFGGLAKLPSDGVPYPIFTYVALLPWQFFASGTRNASHSLLEQQHVIAKVYFPRLVIPLASVISAFVDFMASFVILVGMLVFYRVTPRWEFLTLPLFLLLAGISALAIGLWLAGLAVKYHDVSIAIGFGMTIWQYLTPVAYSASLVPSEWQTLYRLNPMYSVVTGFRWALLGIGQAPDWTVLASSVLILLLLISGAYYFRRTERTIVDVI